MMHAGGLTIGAGSGYGVVAGRRALAARDDTALVATAPDVELTMVLRRRVPNARRPRIGRRRVTGAFLVQPGCVVRRVAVARTKAPGRRGDQSTDVDW